MRIMFICVFMAFTSVHSAVGQVQPQKSSSLPYNVIFITPDQTATRFMHTFGYPLPNTPNIDQFASEGTVFLRAYSAATWTTPSFTSILSGLFPTVHGMTLTPYMACGSSLTEPMTTSATIPQVPSFLTLSLNKPILPEILKALGATTAVDDANCWSLWHIMQRGWDSLKFFPGDQLAVPGHPDRSDLFYLTAPQTTKWAQDWLAQNRDRRFFFWVHYMEPHEPYNAPHEYDRFGTVDDYPDLFADNTKDRSKLESLSRAGDIHAIRRLRQLYAAKILYVDQYIGELLSTIRRLDLDKNTIVVLMSDHGELLYSHPKDYNTFEHLSLYDADTQVPLIIRGPGIPAGRRVDAMVAGYDLLPTILDLEGQQIPSYADGASLKPILSGSSSSAHRYIYGDEVDGNGPLYSIRDQRYKLIENTRNGEIQCYDNFRDPNELMDICSDITEKASELKAALDQHIQFMIQKAKSYPDWDNNPALALLEQRDSKVLSALAPEEEITRATGIQISGRSWSLSTDSRCIPACFWAPPGPATASVIWRFFNVMTGDYDVYISYGGTGQTDRRLATNADYMVRFRGGTLSFSVDQNHNQGQWNLLGRFHDPYIVELSNRTDGPVVAGAVRFTKVK